MWSCSSYQTQVDEGCPAEAGHVVADDHICDPGRADLVYDPLSNKKRDECAMCAGVVVVDIVCCQWCVLTIVAG